MKRSLFAVVCALACVLSASAEGKFKFGIATFPSTDPTLLAITNIEKTVVKAAGGDVITDTPTASSPEASIASVERLITAGAQGLIVMPMADSMLPRVTKMCEEAKVYWAISFRTINDPEIKKLVEASPYYVGNCYEDETAAGYNITKMLAQQGVKNLALITIPKGDTTAERREAGIKKATAEFGIKVVGEIRNIQQASDATKAIESLLATYPELDGVFVVASTVTGIVPALLKGLDNHGKAGKVKLARIDFYAEMTEAFKANTMHATAGGHLVVDPMFATAMAVNAVMGKPLSRTPFSLTVNFMYIKSADESAKYFKYVEGAVPVYTEDEIRSLMLKAFNPNVTPESLQKLAASYSIDDVIKRHKDLVK
jgi:ABC-type sugar transport system substrate-binding protein